MVGELPKQKLQLFKKWTYGLSNREGFRMRNRNNVRGTQDGYGEPGSWERFALHPLRFGAIGLKSTY